MSATSQPAGLAAILNTPPVPAKTFQLALVMGGTVSAGAYTAGAVDFLIEALDAFEAEKLNAGQPYHDVVLNVMAGTSGGAVTAAIMARALAYHFPPRWYGAPAAGPVNPLYDVWVRQLDLMPMLGTDDISRGSVPSLLDGSVIETAAKSIEAYVGEPLPAPRKWLGAPLTVLLTHTNLSGMPVKVDFGGGESQSFIDHADHARFALCYPWQPAYLTPRPDEFTVTFAGIKLPQAAGWDVLGDFALASAAFPLGFPTRQLSRPIAHYQTRIVDYVEGAAGGYRVVQPDWTAMLNTNAAPNVGWVRYSAVDGGVADNEPIELARTALAGFAGHNPRGADEANRAVWLIDPFAGEADMGQFNIAGLGPTGSATLATLMQQSNYSTADLILAADPDVYSRYMLSAQRDGLSGGAALATGGISAFLGFACEAFRSHDYFLGRQNCQNFLQTVFRQAQDNPVFNGWTPAQKTRWADQDGMLPIIPLFGNPATAESRPPWPAGALNPEIFRNAIDTRYKAIVNASLPDNVWDKILGALAGLFTETPVSDEIIQLINRSLETAGLSTTNK
jgi:hypothetical protein